MTEYPDRKGALFDAVPEPVVLVEFSDGNPIVRACNDTFTQQFGYAADEITGESLNDHIVPDDQTQHRIAGEIDEAAAAGRTVERKVTRLTADGRRDFLFRAVPFRNQETIKSVGVYVDITERHRERQRYEALIEHSSDIITILSADGTIRYESPSVEGVLGYEPTDLIGACAFDYIHPDDRARTIEEFERGLTNPDIEPNAEYRFRAADGSWRWVESIGSNHIDNKPIEGYVVNSRDITDRKQRERRLKWYRTYVQYQQKQRKLSETRIELNVLESEYTDDELASNDTYEEYVTRLNEFATEIEELEAELEQLEAEYDELPDSDEFSI